MSSTRVSTWNYLSRFQTPNKLNTSRDSAPSQATKPQWWVVANKAKGDTFTQLAASYTDRCIEQDLKFVVVWVTVGDDGQPDIESDYDSECRTILFTHMKKSLETYAHMTKDVVHGATPGTPTTPSEKTPSQPFQPWITQLNDIFNTLDTVEFTLPAHVRLGFTMTLLESDKRYTAILEKTQEKE